MGDIRQKFGVKFGHEVTQLCEQADKQAKGQTDKHTHHNYICTLPWVK